MVSSRFSLPGFCCRRMCQIVLLLVAVVAASPAAEADLWYQHYQRAEKALEEADWSGAIEQLNQAIERRGDSGVRVRTYGMKTTNYFPYLKLGIAYYELGQLNAALQAFDTEERLGAIGDSQADFTELEHFRSLVGSARQEAAAEEQKRIRQILEQSLAEARSLEGEGRLEEAMESLARGLAVAPEDADAQALMERLRGESRRRQEAKEAELRLARLVEQGRASLAAGQLSEASSLFRQALALRPDDREIRDLLDDSQRRLSDQLQAAERAQDRQVLIDRSLDEAEELEKRGLLGEALDRLQAVMALDPVNRRALEIQDRLLAGQMRVERESAGLANVAEELAVAEKSFEVGRFEESLAAANRALAVDPGNSVALDIVGRAYLRISQRLLGTGTGGNIPPAIRFADFREEQDDGLLIEVVTNARFRLSGVVIDNSPVEITFSDGTDQPMESTASRQPLGDFYLTEFNLSTRLEPGQATFRLVAKDTEALSASSEYTVLYARPFFRAPWFYALLTAGLVVLVSAIVGVRVRRHTRLRRRRFNPYVAGAPVLDEELFVGRQNLIDRILQTVHNNSLLVYGERRMGKTSLLHQLKRRLELLEDPEYEFHPVYIDLQGTPEERFFAVLAEDIFEELAPELKGLRPVKDLDEGTDYSYRDFVHDLRGVFRVLQQRSEKQVKLVMLIDEVDELNDYDPKVNQRLRSLFMKSFADRLVSVVSGVQIKKHWELEGSPWYNFFEEIKLDVLLHSEARELIERPIQGVLKLEDGVADRIISLTGGQPYLIQKLCIALVNRAYEEGRRTITLQDLEAVGRTEAA
jgi:tetratricopeptide (TPR) repeat protein